MDIDHHPGISGLEYAAENGLGVVIAEPLRGGRLAKEPPQSVAKFWANDSSRRTLVEWGLRWVWNHPQVSTLVSDMSTPEQVRQNIALADSAEPDSLSVPEEILISHVRDAYRKLRPILCTACRACMPCPQGVDAPRVFELYNDAVMYADIETARSLYSSEGHHAEICDGCGVCVKRCGNNITIPDQLKAAHKLLTGY
jgi:hypothetical protein